MKFYFTKLEFSKKLKIHGSETRLGQNICTNERSECGSRFEQDELAGSAFFLFMMHSYFVKNYHKNFAKKFVTSSILYST